MLLLFVLCVFVSAAGVCVALFLFLVFFVVFALFVLSLLSFVLLFVLLSDAVFVSNQPKCQPERKTAKLVSPDESCEKAGEQQANMLTAADLESPASALDQSRLYLLYVVSLARSPALSLRQPDQVIAHLSVALPPALLYLHRRLRRYLKCFYLPDKLLKDQSDSNNHLNVKRVIGRSRHPHID